MSDRTQLSIEVRNEDVEQLEKLLDDEIGGPEETYVDDVTTMVFQGVDGGGYYELNKLVKITKIPFTAIHGEGGDYGAYAMISWEGELITLPYHSDHGVVIDPTSDEALADWDRYHEALEKFKGE